MVYLPGLVGRKLVLNLQGSFGDAGRNGTEEEGADDLSRGQNIHPGSGISRLNAIP